MPPAKLWLATATRPMGKLPAGTSVEVIVYGRTGKPNEKELLEALENKYGAALSKEAKGRAHYFSFTEL